MRTDADKLENLDDDFEMAPRFWRREVEDLDIKRSRATGEEKTSRYRSSIRWYPPLLTLSTLMSGVFCWLYVTKPVHVTQTVVEPASMDSSMNLVRQEPMVAQELAFEDKLATSRLASLDPERGGLPGEGTTASRAGAEYVPGQEVQPVVITRERSDVFKPMSKEEIQAAIVERDGSSLEATAAQAVPVEESPVPEAAAEGNNPVAEVSRKESLVELGLDRWSDLPPELEAAIRAAQPADRKPMFQAIEPPREEEPEEELSVIDDSTSMSPREGLSPSLNELRPVDRRVAISLMGELVADHLEAEAALADSKKE